MIYNWYKIFNLDDFIALGLPSKNYELLLSEIGLKNIMVFSGNSISILYGGVFLSIGLNDKNPFEFDDMAVYKDANNDVWMGFAVED